MTYTKMVMIPMDVYKNLLNADGQQHHRIDAPPPPPLNTEEKSPIKRQPQQWIIRKILKGMNKKQLSKIVKKKNVKPKRKNK